MIDILNPVAYTVRGAARPASPQKTAAPLSPASSTSTLKASAAPTPSWSSSAATTAWSRGQQARRYSIESAVSSSTKYNYTPHPSSIRALTADRKLARRQDRSLAKSTTTSKHVRSTGRTNQQPKTSQQSSHKPLLGGLYFSDLVVVAFFYAINLLRTCGLAELFDVAFKGIAFVFTRLPFEFYQRWSLSRATPEFNPALDTPASYQRRVEGRSSNALTPVYPSSDLQASSSARTTSDEETSEQDDVDAQLSPFHHLVILLVKFACTSFPHLIPRVLFAEETIGPLVRWRTGGGAAGIVREFTGPAVSPEKEATEPPTLNQHAGRPNFRAFWIGADAHVPVDVRRSQGSARNASTLLYLHGGGFSLGSVAFYAEALIRIVTKVCRLEGKGNDARCVAVEYDLSPSSRFPGPLLQCLRCYAHLIEVEGIEPSAITIAGDSAGGNLAMAMLLCLDGQAKDEPALNERDWSRLPMPGRAVLISPWADLRPSASIAFAPLRDPDQHQNKRAASGPDVGRVSVWTEAMAQYEWDYVAAEALMHFAQLYSGVLETPRRVRGPMGWVANFCAIIAGDAADLATESKTAPLRFLRLLSSPPRRLVRAAHSMLTEPLLDSASEYVKSRSTEQQTNEKDAQLSRTTSPSAGAMGPIFSKEDRKTDTVPTTSDLFIPVWDSTKLSQEQKEDPHFAAAVKKLDTNKLINPAIGDWSRIKLVHGMLVLWGDRERLADDIEAWVESVRNIQRASKPASTSSSLPVSGFYDDKPSQDGDPKAHRPTARDGPTIQERRGLSQSPPRPNEALPTRESICTAVEHGPAGVHAWPFVSMYLAGSDFEREKGLDIIASFIAKPYSSPNSTNSAIPQVMAAPPLSVKLSSSKQTQPDVHFYSPPHLNPISPAGSMPSDMGCGDSQDVYDYCLNPPSHDGSEEWNLDARNELGLEGVYPHETVWPNPTPTPSTGMGTPVDYSGSEASFDDDALRVGLGLASDAAAMDVALRQIEFEPVHLHRPGQGNQVSAASRAQSSEPATSRAATPRAQALQDAPRVVIPRLSEDVGEGRSLAEMEALDPTSVAASPADLPSPTWSDDEHDEMHPTTDLSALDTDAYEFEPGHFSALQYVDDDVTMDPGYYGLAHYTTLRPEGLSDIEEEDSQIDLSSILNSSGGALSGARTPAYTDEGLSPFESTSPNMSTNRSLPGRHAHEYSPTALDMARLRQALQERERQYQQRFGQGRDEQALDSIASQSRFPLEDTDEGSPTSPRNEMRATLLAQAAAQTARSTTSASNRDYAKVHNLPTFSASSSRLPSGATSPTHSTNDNWW